MPQDYCHLWVFEQPLTIKHEQVGTYQNYS